LAKNRVGLDEARRIVADEAAHRPGRFLAQLDALVWTHPGGPIARLAAAAGIEPGDVRALVADHGLEGALEQLRDAGVYVSYEEYHGRVDAVRGSSSFSFTPADFFNPETRADYIATTGGSSTGKGTPIELSFAWQHRQGRQRPIQHEMAGVRGKPGAVWLPVFPSAAGFGAVMKNMAGGCTPERWFSQVPTDLDGITAHKQAANKFLPALAALTRTGLPSPEHVPSNSPEPVVRWLADALDREGGAILTGYASSLSAAARWAIDHGVDLTGVVANPASEPVTAGKLSLMAKSGMRTYSMYAFTPEGTVGIGCDSCSDEEYHVWDQDLAVITRRRPRGDGTDVDAFCWTSLAMEAPRVLLNVENDDYGVVDHGVACDCDLAELGLTTRVSEIRGISKVVTAGISLDGELFDRLAEMDLPSRLGGDPGDYQFAEVDDGGGTILVLRAHPRIDDLDEAAARTILAGALATSDNGRLAESVWTTSGFRIERAAPAVTVAGKTLSFDRSNRYTATEPKPSGAAPTGDTTQNATDSTTQSTTPPDPDGDETNPTRGSR
jgi:hypothetical protein